MSCGSFSTATTFLKVATFVLLLAFIFLIAGFAFPRWSTLTVSADIYGIGVDANYHVGLWKDCSCTSVLGTETCYCFAKLYITDWLRTVQALVSLGLIGLIISAIISIIILFSRQDKVIRGINILFLVFSGLFVVIGVIIFGIENTEDFEELFNFIDVIISSYDLDTYGSLSASFFLATIAGALCLLVCLPLLVKDYLTPIPPSVQQINPMPVQYTNQGQIQIPPPGQTHFVVNSVQQHGGQQHPLGPAVYVPPGQQMQGQCGYQQSPLQQHQYGPQYPQQQQPQYGVQYPQQDSNQHCKQ